MNGIIDGDRLYPGYGLRPGSLEEAESLIGLMPAFPEPSRIMRETFAYMMENGFEPHDIWTFYNCASLDGMNACRSMAAAEKPERKGKSAHGRHQDMAGLIRMGFFSRPEGMAVKLARRFDRKLGLVPVLDLYRDAFGSGFSLAYGGLSGEEKQRVEKSRRCY